MKRKYEIASITKSTAWEIKGENGEPFAEIHLGRFAAGKYSVRIVVGLGLFVVDGVDHPKEVDTIEEAAEIVDSFLDCGAVETVRKIAPDADVLESMRSRLCAALGLPADSAPETVAEAVEARRVVVPELTEEALVRAGGAYCINDREPFRRGARWAVKFVSEHSRAIPADRVLGEALTHISLCSRNSASSKEECGKIARMALWRSKYGPERIAWELDETASGRAYYGNALRVAKDFPGITPEERGVLDAWSTGLATCDPKRNFSWPLQEIAAKLRALRANQGGAAT